MIPGEPAHPFQPDEDDEDARDRILALIDESPSRHVIIAMPHAKTNADLDALEEHFRRVYDLAKDARPDLAVKLHHNNVDTGHGTNQSRIVALIHEHLWVGGVCIHGCRDTRPVGGEDVQ